jgi:hypothetical protein
MNFLPLATGGLVGLGDGVIGQVVRGHKVADWFPKTIYEALVFGAGVYGELSGQWQPDISYALMASSAALFGSHVPGALASGRVQSLGYRASLPQTAGCSSCGQVHAATAPPCVGCGVLTGALPVQPAVRAERPAGHERAERGRFEEDIQNRTLPPPVAALTTPSASLRGYGYTQPTGTVA